MSHGRLTPASSATAAVVVARLSQLGFGNEGGRVLEPLDAAEFGREESEGVKVPWVFAVSLTLDESRPVRRLGLWELDIVVDTGR
jgi:hypothetical protein